MSRIRSKFKCHSVTEYEGGSKKANCSAVYSETGENADFAKASPAGSVEIQIDSDTPAVDYFTPGKEYYVDFTEVPPADA